MNKFSNANLLPMGKRKRPEEEKEEITAFGYESKIYNDEATAVAMDSEKYLIPWKTSHLLMDRYDVRHLLDELVEVKEKAKLEEEYDIERYMIEEKYESKNNVGGTTIAYDYNCEYKKHKRVVTEIENEIMKKYNTPEEMIVPDSYAQLSIMETISKEICHATNGNLLEIRIQVKNASNACYSFLNKQDILYPFYKHIGSNRFSANLVDYSDSEDEEEEEDEIKARIDQTALMIMKSPNSVALEEYLLKKNGHQDKFLFLNQGNAYYDYFQKAKEKQNK
ncbi:hypothetical protein INT47_002811 [Mucor saturninus]|uniref:SURP motif domain-containing protein n=1 Tax=Mucor saturninus TaxID=64648 RepID=A0A8H7V0C0_9FUNG|nr:hypothetical protein INT47_002811 [Mucor saturninus]